VAGIALITVSAGAPDHPGRASTWARPDISGFPAARALRMTLDAGEEAG